FNVLPLRRGAMSGTAYLLVAMADPTNLMVIDTLQFLTGCRIRPAIAPESRIREAIELYYRGERAVRLADSESGPTDAGPAVQTGTETVAPRKRARTVEQKLQALLEKLHELGVLTRQEYEELK
ncbi:MAG: hypothetical protein D6794_04895, partial [Deltaproteobacteria bacterium]